jgi:purine-binding chemotaxis protein CheW
MELEAVTEMGWDADGRIEILTFALGPGLFAFEAGHVREIIDPMPETRVPKSPSLAGSIINFRGRIIPLADLRPVFGQSIAKGTQESRFIIIESEFSGHLGLIGVKADRVNEVKTASLSDVEPMPCIGIEWNPDFIRCLLRSGNDIVILPDIKHILRRYCNIEPRPHLPRHEVSHENDN